MKGRKKGLTNRQMILLETIDKYPDIGSAQLCKIAGYSRRENITSKIRILKDRGYLRGRIYDVDISAIARNPIDRLILIFEFDLEYGYILGILKSIFCWKWVYPLEEGVHRQLAMMFYSSNESALLSIFDYLCERGILHDYVGYKMVGEPQRCSARFCGKSESPYLGDLIGEVPKENPRKTHRVPLNRCDLNLIMYLQDGHFGGNVRKIADHYRNTLGFDADYKTQWLKSYRKLKERGIVQPRWIVFPQPIDECRAFLLLLRGIDGESTKQICYNLARDERVYVWRALVVGLAAGIMRSESMERLYSFFIIHSDTTFYQSVVGYLDEQAPSIPSIKRFSIRQFNPGEKMKRIHPDMPSKPTNWWDGKGATHVDTTEIPNYASTLAINLEPDVYDLKTQTLYYPYDEYKKSIEHIVEK